MATCTRCGQPLEVQQPLWKWALYPRCMTCEDGQAEIGQVAVSPEQFPQLSMAISPQVIDLSCEQVGLPPLAVVEVWTEGENPRYFRLPGSVDELFIAVPGDQFGDVVPNL